MKIIPVQGVKFPRNKNEIDRSAKIFTIRQLYDDPTIDALEISSIGANFSKDRRFKNIQGICELTEGHFRAYREEYKSKTGKNFDDIEVVDQYAPAEAQSFSITIGASLNLGGLRRLFPKLDISADAAAEIAFESSDARQRIIRYKSDRDFLYKKIRFGPYCKGQFKKRRFAKMEKYFIDNITYGNYKPTVTLRSSARWWAFRANTKVIKGEEFYGVFLFKHEGLLN